MPASEFRAKLITMKRMLASAAVVLAALAVTPAPAGADPSPFGALGCSCDSVTGVSAGTPDVKDQVNQGIQNGLASLHHNRGS
jgi:hypothetical protein